MYLDFSRFSLGFDTKKGSIVKKVKSGKSTTVTVKSNSGWMFTVIRRQGGGNVDEQSP